MRIPSAVGFIIVLALSGGLAWSSLTTGHNWGDDFSAYIAQARSIVQGNVQENLEENRFTIQASPVGPVAYPWGFPLLLASVYWASGLDILALKSVGVICYLAFLCVLWFGFRKTHSDSWRIILVCLFAFNPSLLSSLNDILSDIPFLLFSTLSVTMIGAVVVEKRCLISPVWDRALLGASMAMAFLVRTNGVLLVCTLAAVHGMFGLTRFLASDGPRRGSLARLRAVFVTAQGNWRQIALNTLPYAVFVAVGLAPQIFLPGGGASSLGGLFPAHQLPKGFAFRLIVGHIDYYFGIFQHFFLSLHYSQVIYGATIPLAVGGMLRRYRADFHLIVYSALTCLLYILWPSIQQLRFVFPVLPFYMSFCLTCLEGTVEAATGKERKFRQALCIVPALFVVVSFGLASVKIGMINLDRQRESESGAFTIAARNMYAFVAERTDPKSVVIFVKPRLMRLMTGRPSRSKFSPGVDYVCLARNISELRGQLRPEEAQRLASKGELTLVYENSEFIVFRVNKR